MVPVEVRQHEQVDPVDAQEVQAGAESLRIVADVHQCGAAPAADEHRVPLSHVARGDGPVARQPRAHDESWHGDEHDPDRCDRARGEEQ
ncbi:hypothetical protein ACEN85_17495, partial [Curtobacterium sp. CT11-45]|uniref:hypothetical protein n=1 Tax=Curtobacterium sp. CT11-45 TaxID=3243037 RepID=UPI0039B01674